MLLLSEQVRLYVIGLLLESILILLVDLLLLSRSSSPKLLFLIASNWFDVTYDLLDIIKYLSSLVHVLFILRLLLRIEVLPVLVWIYLIIRLLIM